MTTKTPTSFVEAEVELSRLVISLAGEFDRIDNAIASLVAAELNLSRLATAAPNGYQSLKQWLDSEAVANPTDEAILNAKARMDRIVTDFVAKRQYVTQVLTAINAV